MLLFSTAIDGLQAADIKKGDIRRFETLSLHDETYTNAVVEGVSTNVVFIRHTRGIAMVKIKDLTIEEAKTLGVEAMLPASSVPQPAASKRFNEEWQKIVELMTGFVGAGMGFVILGAMLVFWIVWCYCLKRMCRKAGTESGVLIWFPVLQLFPMHQAAHISGLLVLAYFVPFIGGIVFIYWALKMCEAVGKTKWLALPLLLPGFNLFTVAYLAFSKED